MELRSPRRKKKCKPELSLALPISVTSKDEIYKFTGRYDGFSVVIDDLDEMQKVNKMGFFGKASLSRSFPTFNTNGGIAKIIRKRQFLRRNEWNKSGRKPIPKVIVVPDSDTDDENYFANLKPEYQLDKSGVKETLNLSLIEAFYLCHDVKCLDVYDDNNTLIDEENLWSRLSEADKLFVPKYVAYYHFCRKNWIVKPGIKFGGDLLLYKDGPPFYHASYVVIIDILDENLKRRDDIQIRSMKFVHIVGLNRLCETAGKELLICQLIWPRNLNVSSAERTSDISVKELIMRRWISNRETVNLAPKQ